MIFAIVNPFWLGVGVGVFAVILLELIAIVAYAVCASKNGKGGEK